MATYVRAAPEGLTDGTAPAPIDPDELPQAASATAKAIADTTGIARPPLMSETPHGLTGGKLRGPNGRNVSGGRSGQPGAQQPPGLLVWE